MSAVVKLGNQGLEALLERYGLGPLQRYWTAAGGVSNSTLFLRLAGGPGRPAGDLVLTLADATNHLADDYLELLEVLLHHGLPVPEVLRTLDGSAFETLDGRTAVLCRRLPGRHVFNPTLNQVAAVGRFLARMHLATAALSRRNLDRNADGLRQQAEATRGYLPYTSMRLLDDAVSQVQSLLRRQDVQLLPVGVLHTDLQRDNVLFNDLGLSGVLDFYQARSGPLVFDLGVVANDWCTESSGLLDRDRVLALLKAYHRLRPLAEAELWYFSGFALYGALVNWLNRLTLASGDGSQSEHYNNARECERIVRQHAAHAFYPDPRILD